MSVRDITDRTAVGEALANTYAGDREGWERVLEYQRVMDYAAKHPKQKSTAVSNALDLPRGRIRAWVEGDGAPDPAHGVQVAENHRWLDLDWADSPFTHLNVLVAWVFAGGSINANFVPLFAVDTPRHREFIQRVLDELDLGSSVRREDEPGRATEVVPGTDASVLGRLLVALGAPQGTKNVAAELELPPYLATAPRERRLDFARTYMWVRGTESEERPNWPIVVSEERSPEFKRALRSFLRSLVDDSAGVSGGTSAHSLRLSPDAADVLYREPSIGEYGEEMEGSEVS